MESDIRVSVAMAAYNGEKYIKEQLETILACLSDRDEVVVSDDGSTDSTKTIVESLGDPRIRLIDGPRKGIKQNFANAISNCHGKYVFLSDQDDIWMESKVEAVLRGFEQTNAPVIVHDCRIADAEGEVIEDSFYEFKGSGPGAFKNIVRNCYIGCCMAFDREKLAEIILPIPDNILMHDQWIGVLGDHFGGSVFIPDKLIKYRRHGGNAWEVNKHFGFMTMLRNRLILIKELSKRLRETK